MSITIETKEGERKSTITVMDHSGDTKYTWSSSRRDEVDQARTTFNDLRGKGYVAYRVDTETGKRADVMSEFDPAAEAIIMHKALAGG